MKCANCGKEYNDGVKFCSICGTKLDNNLNSNINSWDYQRLEKVEL